MIRVTPFPPQPATAPQVPSGTLNFVPLDAAARKMCAPSVAEFVALLDALPPAVRADLGDHLLRGGR